MALGHLDHPEALPALEGFLRAPQPWQRVAAVTATSQRSDAPAARALQWVAAADDEQDVAQAAIQGLARIARRPGPQGAEAAQALVALTAEPLRREAAIQALSELPARRIADVARGLGDSSPDVRCASVEALGRMQQAGRIARARGCPRRWASGGAAGRNPGAQESRHARAAEEVDDAGSDRSRHGCPARSDVRRVTE